MIKKLKKIFALLLLHVKTIIYSPTIVKDTARDIVKNSNEKIEDKMIVPIANNANKVTKLLLKTLLIVFILLILAIIISSAWDALSITVNGTEIKSMKEAS